ncbi:L-threonylcarbamoyladenylate synthase [Streptococcus vestibularis]|uniref:L-threonylcarbamoyladenylate synthase n=1 Tax=Streptococcus vestibularis TaxID=1343 RepID=UPI00232DB6C6|nr:L-threonylcarbamoyladenylate synthase [Streptococcus vestibularis]MDB6216922.1 L-threonylcarbamoyladenylate synthase [Streptococcus vestibularis]
MMKSKKILREILADGGAVVLPTETVYGLFAKAMDESAVNHVYELKNRPRDKAMNLNVASYEDILSYSKEQPKYLKQLYDAFLPGPLTIILKANDQVPKWINSELTTVGFRLPNHPVTRELIQAEGPLIGPSANKSGKESGRHFDDIRAQFDFQVTGYRDDNALLGVDSTILDLSVSPARILRQGKITKDDLLAALPELTIE